MVSQYLQSLEVLLRQAMAQAGQVNQNQLANNTIVES
jgi:hypothetical protein